MERRVSVPSCHGAPWEPALVCPLLLTSPPRALCRLQDAYLDALEQCGGLHEARPKALLDILQARFPYLTLQVGMLAAGVAGSSRENRRQSGHWGLPPPQDRGGVGRRLASCAGRGIQTATPARLPSALTTCNRTLLQNVKNHLQKQRTKEAKNGGGAG